MLDPTIGFLIVYTMALLFGSAALHKYRSRKQFATALEAYRLLPKRIGPIVADLLAALELTIAVGLLVGATRGVAVIAGASVLVLYGAAIAINLWRGRLDLDCGCTGPYRHRPIARWMAWRNLGLGVYIGLVALPWSARPLSGIDFLTIGGGFAALTVMYVAFEQLLGQTIQETAAARSEA